MFDVTECFKKRLCCLISNPKRGITYAWLASLLLVLIAFIVACTSAASMKETGTSAQITSFAAVWTAILLIFLSVAGTVIMRRFQTALAIGYFLGVIFIMCQQMLIIFALFVERSQQSDNSPSATSSQKAMAVFAFFLFTVYAGFGSMLAVFRHDVIKEEVLGEDPDARDAESAPEQPEYK